MIPAQARKDFGTFAHCSACGDVGRLWLGLDETGGTAHLIHDPESDGSFVCGAAKVYRSAPRLRPGQATTWRNEEEEL